MVVMYSKAAIIKYAVSLSFMKLYQTLAVSALCVFIAFLFDQLSKRMSAGSLLRFVAEKIISMAFLMAGNLLFIVFIINKSYIESTLDRK